MFEARGGEVVSSLCRRRVGGCGSFMLTTRRLKDKDAQSRWQAQLRHGLAAEFRVCAVAIVESPCIPPTTTANPSVKGSANGAPPGPGHRYAVHFLWPGPGVTPSSPPYLER